MVRAEPYARVERLARRSGTDIYRPFLHGRPRVWRRTCESPHTACGIYYYEVEILHKYPKGYVPLLTRAPGIADILP